MREALQALFNETFVCTRCSQKLMNPYLHKNLKNDPDSGPAMAENRRRFFRRWLDAKEDIRLVIVGEAPGLDGCGYAGIPFTGEYNAITHLGLPDFHGLGGKYQREASANLIYGALGSYAAKAGLTIPQAASKLWLTNAVLCVPLKENGKSITYPRRETLLNCRPNLLAQLEIIQPRAVITLGDKALRALTAALELPCPEKLIDLVARQRRQAQPVLEAQGLAIIPEIHPSPLNQARKDLYTQLPPRLEQLFALYLEDRS